MYNTFKIISCVDLSKSKEKGRKNSYSGSAVALSNIQDDDFVILFPISEEVADIVVDLMKSEDKEVQNKHVPILDVYTTMIASWANDHKFLSGIIMEVSRTENKKNPDIKLAMVNDGGFLMSTYDISFAHAIVLAILEEVYFVISDDLLKIMLPDVYNKDSNTSIPDNMLGADDGNLMKIAKDIMSGKIK